MFANGTKILERIWNIGELPLKRFFRVFLIVGIFVDFANFCFVKLAEND